MSEHVTDEFDCPRRIPGSVADRNFPGPDKWETHRNKKGERTCTHCGGIHPDDFVPILKAACDPVDPTRIDWSDKPYKIYISRPDVRNASDGAIKSYGGHGLPTGMSKEEFLALLREANKASKPKFEISFDNLKKRLDRSED